MTKGKDKEYSSVLPGPLNSGEKSGKIPALPEG